MAQDIPDSETRELLLQLDRHAPRSETELKHKSDAGQGLIGQQECGMQRVSGSACMDAVEDSSGLPHEEGPDQADIDGDETVAGDGDACVKQDKSDVGEDPVNEGDQTARCDRCDCYPYIWDSEGENVVDVVSDICHHCTGTCFCTTGQIPPDADSPRLTRHWDCSCVLPKYFGGRCHFCGEPVVDCSILHPGFTGKPCPHCGQDTFI